MEETGTPVEIQAPDKPRTQAAEPVETSAGAAGEARLIARDEKKNPLISTFDWTTDATQRIFRVPAGFMRSQTQERIEALARERGVSAIDLALVEDGIEIGKQMMAQMIATYSGSSTSPAAQASAAPPAAPAQSSGAARNVMVPAGNGSGYLNEVSPLTVRRSSEYPEG